MRVLRDGLGDLVLGDESVRLDRGTVNHLRREEVEHLVRQGYLEHIIEGGARGGCDAGAG